MEPAARGLPLAIVATAFLLACAAEPPRKRGEDSAASEAVLATQRQATHEAQARVRELEFELEASNRRTEEEIRTAYRIQQLVSSYTIELRVGVSGKDVETVRRALGSTYHVVLVRLPLRDGRILALSNLNTGPAEYGEGGRRIEMTLTLAAVDGNSTLLGEPLDVLEGAGPLEVDLAKFLIPSGVGLEPLSSASVALRVNGLLVSRASGLRSVVGDFQAGATSIDLGPVLSGLREEYVAAALDPARKAKQVLAPTVVSPPSFDWAAVVDPGGSSASGDARDTSQGFPPVARSRSPKLVASARGCSRSEAAHRQRRVSESDSSSM
jgi:hypothetical protein